MRAVMRHDRLALPGRRRSTLRERERESRLSSCFIMRDFLGFLEEQGDAAIVSSPWAIVGKSAFCRSRLAALGRIGKPRRALIIPRSAPLEALKRRRRMLLLEVFKRFKPPRMGGSELQRKRNDY